MSQLDTILEGKHRVTGRIRRYQRLTQYEDAQESDLRVFQLTLDNDVEVYLHSTQEYFEEILKRVGRPATFSGEFVDAARTKIICQTVVFLHPDGDA